MKASARSRLAAALAALSSVAVACGGGDTTGGTSPPPASATADVSSSAAATDPGTTDAPAASAPATTAAVEAVTSVSVDPPADVTVEIGEFVFDPPDVHVSLGGTVTWTNTHTQPHTATSAGVFDTGAIQPGASVSQTFAEAGTFDFICSFHPFMTGSVVVG